jgi:hypothetical protein
LSQLGTVFEAVLARYAGGAYEDEAARARRGFLETTGQVFDDDPLFEERISAFLEWYALERKMEGSGLRPIDRYLREVELDAAAERAAQALAASHWSLFRVGTVQVGAVELEDLLAGGHWLVHERRRLPGMEPGDVFEARLVSDGGKTLFGRSFCFHPRDAAAAILEFVDRAAVKGEDKQQILLALAERRVRSERYRNVAVARIYAYA